MKITSSKKYTGATTFNEHVSLRIDALRAQVDSLVNENRNLNHRLKVVEAFISKGETAFNRLSLWQRLRFVLSRSDSAAFFQNIAHSTHAELHQNTPNAQKM